MASLEFGMKNNDLKMAKMTLKEVSMSSSGAGGL